MCVAASGGPERRSPKAGRKRGSTVAKLAAEKKAAEKMKRQRQTNDSFWKRTGSGNEEASTAEGSSAGARGSTPYESTAGVSNAGE